MTNQNRPRILIRLSKGDAKELGRNGVFSDILYFNFNTHDVEQVLENNTESEIICKMADHFLLPHNLLNVDRYEVIRLDNGLKIGERIEVS